MTKITEWMVKDTVCAEDSEWQNERRKGEVCYNNDSAQKGRGKVLCFGYKNERRVGRK